MSITGMARRTFRVTRPSSTVVDGLAAASPGLVVSTTLAAGRSGAVSVEVAAIVNGTVFVSGLDAAGVAQTETLTLTAQRFQEGVKSFSKVTGVLASFADRLTLRVVGDGGEPVNALSVVAAKVWARLDRTSDAWVFTEAGARRTKVGGPHIIFERSQGYTPRNGDIMEDLLYGEVWRVTGTLDELGGFDARHFEVPVERADGAALAPGP